jgi:hypothetical protein
VSSNQVDAILVCGANFALVYEMTFLFIVICVSFGVVLYAIYGFIFLNLFSVLFVCISCSVVCFHPGMGVTLPCQDTRFSPFFSSHDSLHGTRFMGLDLLFTF